MAIKKIDGKYPFQVPEEPDGIQRVVEATLINLPKIPINGVILTSVITPTNPIAGQVIFDGTHFRGWNGSTWVIFG